MPSLQLTSGPDQSAEISGYLAIGLPDEALKTARALLRRRTLNAADFRAALLAIGINPRPRRWRKLILRAHRRLSVTDREIARTAMLGYHAGTNDLPAASRFLPRAAALSAASAEDLLVSMETCLALGRWRKARQVTKECETRLLQRDETTGDTGSLLHAVAIHAARTGHWNYAIKLWEHAPVDDPVYCEGILKAAYAATLHALLVTHTGLEKIAALREQAANTSTGFVEAGLLRELHTRTGSELRRIGRRVARALPAGVTQDFGVQFTSVHPAGAPDETEEK